LKPNHRLGIAFDVGNARLLLDALSVLEVARPPPEATMLRGQQPLIDLAELLGGVAAGAGGPVLVLDSSPTLALRVDRVREVVGLDPQARRDLPGRFAEACDGLYSCAFVLEEQLFLELSAETLARGKPAAAQRLFRVTSGIEPARALVFNSQGLPLAAPLEQVLQIIPRSGAYCATLRAEPFTGLVLHRGALCPVVSVPGLIGTTAREEALIVLIETGQERLGVFASKALGVREGSRLGSATVLDLGRMFS
jgi:chemotaxis signal transduction protein